MGKRKLEIETRLSELKASLNSLETRSNEILENVDKENDETKLQELNSEVETINESRNAFILEEKKLNKELEEILQVKNDAKEAETKGKKIEKENVRMTFERNTPEYRTAFFKNLAGMELTPEERAVTTGDSIALPVATEDAIWNNIYGQHSILNDIKIYRTGTILEVTKHTAITAGKAAKKNEATESTLETNTFVKVTLSGDDFAKVVEISYAAAKMSQGALEDYLVTEISQGLGEALAEEVVANIIAGTHADNKVVKATPEYSDLAALLGKLQRVGKVVIYCSSADKYTKIMGMVDTTKQPIFRDGVALGVEVKVEDACNGAIIAIDPQKYVGNMVQDILIESDKNLVKHVFEYSGYCRFEGTLVDDKSAAVLSAA